MAATPAAMAPTATTVHSDRRGGAEPGTDSTRVTFPRERSSASIRAISADFTAGGGDSAVSAASVTTVDSKSRKAARASASPAARSASNRARSSPSSAPRA